MKTQKNEQTTKRKLNRPAKRRFSAAPCHAAAVKALMARANQNERTLVMEQKFPSTYDALIEEANKLRYAALWLKKQMRHND